MSLRLSIVMAFALALCGCITAEQQASVAEPSKPITCFRKALSLAQAVISSINLVSQSAVVISALSRLQENPC